MFFLPLNGHKLGIEQRLLFPIKGLKSVFHEKQLFVRLARLFRTSSDELLQLAATLRDGRHCERKEIVALKLQLRHGQFASGAAGVSRYKYQISIFRPVCAPVQVVRGGYGLVVGVRPQQADIEIEAGEVEIVRIAAELRGRKLRREHQTHVGIALVAVQIVDPAVVQRNQIAAQAWIRSAAFLQLRLFCIERFVRGIAGFAGRRSLHIAGHIVNLNQLIEFEIRAFFLFGGGFRGESGIDKILLRRR